jgi:3-phosphoshikimate 1-carboxyvinyltransferase
MENPAIQNQQSAIEILPVSHAPNATVRVPGSKSLTNRALLVAALAEGTTTLTNALFSDDSYYFAESLKELGFDVQPTPQLSTFTVTGHGGLIPASHADLYVGNAGTAARFLTAMLTLGNGEYVVDGDPRMRQRPIGDLMEALTQLGANVASPTGCLPVHVLASGLRGGHASVAGNVSSQFLSGLLMVAPSAQSEVELNVEHGLNSKPYVDMTLTVMSDFGVEISRDGYERFVIRSARYQSRETYAIESDASAASYFFAAPAILGGSVRVENISRQSKQGDIAFLGILQQMGCVVADGPDFIEVTGPDRLSGIDVDMRDISDTAQTLAVIAPFASSPTRIRGIGFIRKKETDRIAAVCTELTRLGVEVQENSDGMTIQPCASIRPACVQTYKDHRMAMAFALIGLRAPGISIENPACVSKTFPNYFEMLETLR